MKKQFVFKMVMVLLMSFGMLIPADMDAGSTEVQQGAPCLDGLS